MSGECDKCGEHTLECGCYKKELIHCEWGGTARCMTSDGRNVNMAEELNRIEKDKPQKEPTMYVKFSRNITLLESFLKDNNVEYNQEDLEDTPLGKGYVIRRD